jgi:hypothetical protein
MNPNIPPRIDIVDGVRRMHRNDIIFHINQAGSYLDKVASLIEKSEKDEADKIRIRNTEQGISPEEHFPELDISAYVYECVFTEILYYSVVMHLCSTIELKLMLIAEKLHDFRKDSTVSLIANLHQENSRDKMKDRIAKYIKKHFSYDIKRDTRWQTVCDVFWLRDVIAHSNGVINIGRFEKASENQSMFWSIQSKYKKHGEISAYQGGIFLPPQYGKIKLSSAICRFFISEIEAYFNDLLDGLGHPFK